MVSGHKSRSDGAPVYRSSYHVRSETAADNHRYSGLDSEPGCLQLGYHPAARIHPGLSFSQPGHRVNIAYLRDKLAIFSEQTFHTGQQYEKVGAAEYRYFSG